ncbi:hypothetical protein [Flavobacterium sp. '19STA2R22 D10 B1']|uniref:hypothetical protein n=1 Tax=Flavobacterium aerium TaxID=3037261 RepID=UPI00278C03DC|nr:hypothetical protein [Flavobacterium sp. '19STA2R22 D10 B1']
MKKLILLFTIVCFASCGVKKTQTMLSNGDYDGAIDKAVDNLRSNKTSKGKQDYIYLLEEAYAKAIDRDKRDISMLEKDKNPANIERLYNTYMLLNNRQERIRPILPLYLMKEGRNAIFPFSDYSNQIIEYKNALSKYLYNNAVKLLTLSKNKMDARQAFDDLTYIENINPNYKDVHSLMDEARFKGTDFVQVSTSNETNMVIPIRLQNDLLNFDTYGLDDKWTVYHSSKQKGINYDYGMIVNFRQISISPEQIREKQFIRERQIKDGTKDLLDRNGKPVRDDKGNIVKVDVLRDVKIDVYEFTQFKSCQVVAKVDYVDYKSNQLIQSFPITSEFVFQNIYANYKGDRRAIDDNYYGNFTRKPMLFPSNEQMVFDTGEDLKSKLKSIITQNKFR